MVAKKLETFHYEKVTLKKSHWERQRAELIETYLGIDNEDLLHYFRALAKIPDKGTGLVGWYGDNASTFGQKLSAMARLYLNTKDERLKTKVLYLADEWGKCLECSEKVCDINDTYVYDKLMGGFLDLYEILGYTPALKYIKKLTQSAARRFPRTISRDGLQDRALSGAKMIEWYTLPEHLIRAWQITGDETYWEFAKEWEYTYYYDKLEKKDFHIGPRHAYSHVNSLSSAAKFYEATGDEKCLTILKNGYEEWNQQISLRQDTVTVSAHLEESVRYGTVVIACNEENASVIIDGVDRGTAPLQISLAYGNHEIVVQKDGFSAYRETVRVQDSVVHVRAELS